MNHFWKVLMWLWKHVYMFVHITQSCTAILWIVRAKTLPQNQIFATGLASLSEETHVLELALFLEYGILGCTLVLCFEVHVCIKSFLSCWGFWGPWAKIMWHLRCQNHSSGAEMILTKLHRTSPRPLPQPLYVSLRMCFAAIVFSLCWLCCLV